MIERRSLFAWIAGVAASFAAGRWFRNEARAEEKITMTEQEKIDLFLKHVGAEIAGDMETTMATMTGNPHLTNVPTRVGGYGYDGVRSFYRNHLVGKFFPPDMTMTPVSRTVGENQIVDELVIKFTHTTKIDWMLPDIEPTGRPVEVAFAVIVGIRDGKISHEHIYWDQATVLAQIGLLDPAGLPVVGADGARRVLDPGLHAQTATP
jgi:carboxymethylenebutenolidase